MSFTPMDLDSSLDDIIKKKKQGHQNKPSNHNNSNNKPKKSSSAKVRNQQQRPAIQTTKAKVTKPAPRSNINARLSSKTGPLFSAHTKQKVQQRQQQQQQKSQPIRADPSQIIITKAISPADTVSRNRDSAGASNARPALSSGLASRLGSINNSNISRARQQQQQPVSQVTGPTLSRQSLQQQVRHYSDETTRQPSQPQIRSMISRPMGSAPVSSSSSSSSAYHHNSAIISSSSSSSSKYPSDVYSSSYRSGGGEGGGGRAEAGRYSFSGRGRMHAEPVPQSAMSSAGSRSVPGIVGASSGLSIRGRSSINQQREKTDISIRGESGPTTVLVTGLDPEANSEDVYITMEPFGHILRCEVMRDRSGRSYGEAEVEFSRKHFALDAIAMLDNKMCDGQILRVILREKPKSKSVEHFVQKQIRSIISSPSGKMYSDRL